MVYNYLLKFGFKPNNIGFCYLVDLITLGIQGENLEPMSKVGYKIIANKYNKNTATIEKDIQNSINNAWLYGNNDLLYQTFGATISD
ncbi:MAG: sporulation initiation factor Spo0A C-terminal domain-containing protein, partial [Clostridia bacterium]|nr:sporulation initiation factor Spo0A C-terminal domain-containing protein [Clostridia bacterium]